MPSETKLDGLGGRTLLEFLETEAVSDRRKLSAVKALRENPDSRLVTVSYSKTQREKKDYRTSAECLLKEVVDNDALPSYVARQFMRHSHININDRMTRTSMFRVGIEETSLAEDISRTVDKVSSLGFLEGNVNGKNITFGQNSTTGWDARDLVSGFNRFGSLLKVKGPVRIGFIPRAEMSTTHQEFINEVMRLVEKGSESCEFIGALRPSSQFDLNATRLSREYEEGASGVDCLLIELEHHEGTAWRVWKKATNRLDVRSQMITSSKFSDRFAAMNIAFGILGKLGGVPFTIDRMKTSIEMWIGLDVGRRPGSNLGASCVAFEADGRQLGWSAPEFLEGERITSEVLNRILTNFIEEVNILREREGKPPLKSIGILRDGRFYEQMSDITEIEDKFELELTVLEVRKSGAPRLADRSGMVFTACGVGTIIWQDDWGFLQPNKERPGMGSPVILQVQRLKSSEDMEDILHDLFWLSKMHIGATMQPGLPVPIHYADRLSKYAGLGVVRNPSFTTNLDFL